jgi:hypothetical protein
VTKVQLLFIFGFQIDWDLLCLFNFQTILDILDVIIFELMNP